MISKADNLQHYNDVPQNNTMFTCKDCIMLWFLNSIKKLLKKIKIKKNRNFEIKKSEFRIGVQKSEKFRQNRNGWQVCYQCILVQHLHVVSLLYYRSWTCSRSYHCTVMQVRTILSKAHDVTITLCCVLVWIYTILSRTKIVLWMKLVARWLYF